MRLIHPSTLSIATKRNDIPKTVISHAWSEAFKFLKTGKKHPKMFMNDPYDYGVYLYVVYIYGKQKGCNLDQSKVSSLPILVYEGYVDSKSNFANNYNHLIRHFDENYLFSDAVSLYFKGINIFPDIFGDDWRKYVPVESHKEIKRQIDKTLTK